jgi:arylsulfatase A-like enzyme
MFFFRTLLSLMVVLVLLTPKGSAAAAPKIQPAPRQSADTRPSILLCIADDASWHHFGLNGDRVVRTPHIDRLAREGVTFRHAFCSSPSCTPSRGAILTGQHFWRLGEGANLWSRWPNTAPVYPDLLAHVGYAVGLQGKGWGPGDFRTHGRDHNPAGPAVRDFAQFLDGRPPDSPFCFWFGSLNPHRLYERGSGTRSGLQAVAVDVPPFLPDTPTVREDLLDYRAEIERFDAEVGERIQQLETRGELENTLVVITSDNGFPFPRGKATCYDAGVRMPLILRWPARFPGGRVLDDFVSLTDIAPTFLEAAGLRPPKTMTGRSLLPLLDPDRSKRIDRHRTQVFFGRERHANVRPDDLGYPIRGVRTGRHLYLRNFAPDRWPAGDPPIYGDVDQAGDIAGSPSKQAVVEHGPEPGARRLFDLAFGKRPEEELYDVQIDPWQTNNLAGDPRQGAVLRRLRRTLERELIRTGDPRLRGEGDMFDRSPYVTGGTVVRPR